MTNEAKKNPISFKVFLFYYQLSEQLQWPRYYVFKSQSSFYIYFIY